MKKWISGFLAVTMIAVWATPSFAVQTTAGTPEAIVAEGILNGVTFGGAHVLTVADNENINTAANAVGVTSGADGQGTITFAGTSTVSGTVGTNAANDLLAINAGAAGETVTLSGNAFILTSTVTGTGTLALGANLTGTSVAFGADGTVTAASGNTIAAAFTGAANVGTITYAGGNTQTGNIGNNGVKQVNITTGDVNVTGNVLASRVATSTGDLIITGTFNNTMAGDTPAINSTVAGPLATQYGQITSGGAATVVADTLVTLNVTGYIANGTTLTIVDGTGGAGVATLSSAIVDNSANLSFAQDAADTANLVLTATRLSTSSVTTSANANSVATAATAAATAAPTSALATDIGQIDKLSTVTATDAAYSQLDPNVSGGAVGGSMSALNGGIQSITSRNESVRGGTSSGISAGDLWQSAEIWAKGFGNFADQDNRGGVNGYDADTWGTTIGVDGPINEEWRLGGAGGYAISDVDTKNENSTADIDSVQGSIYATYDSGPWFLDTSFTFAWNMYDAARGIAFGTINRVASSDYDGQQYSGYVGTGYVYAYEGWEITPMASFQYTHIAIDGYTETGAGALNLVVDSQDYDVAQSGLGIKFAYPVKDQSGTFTPEVHTKWLYDFVGDEQATTSTFTGGGASFSTRGYDPAQHSFNVGGGLSWKSKGNWTVEGTYDLELKEDFSAHTGLLTVKYAY